MIGHALILAGGLGRRLGGRDKALLPLAGRPLLAHVQDRLAGQAGRLWLSANGDPARFAGFGLTIISDAGPPGAGPLAGILAGLDAVAAAGDADRAAVLVVPVDAPLLPADLAARLSAAQPAPGTMVLAASGGRRHPVIGLWPLAMRADIRAALARRESKVGALPAAAAAGTVEWPSVPYDPFLNVNRPEDAAAAELLLSAYAAPR